ncbi:hypothetical protein [Nocardioides sp.]|uniref:hypothetical protein n=1 Tax=Nocardioides sp. TaxID=35761 RepID=UPI0025F4F4C6|nr:hypothetical protein [Nocardioides sp.]
MAVPILALGLVVSVLALAAPADAKRVRPGFFGMHDTRISGGTLTTLPIGAVRVWDSGTSWREIEKRRGHYDLGRLRTAVRTARSAGVRPLIVLGQTPRFHARHPHAPGAYGRGATSMPRLTPWKRYVAKLARTFGTTVDYQIWNEPNVVNYWTGSVSQMALLTATAGRTIERVAGRRAVVVAPAFPLRLSSQRAWYRAYWHASVRGRGIARFVDVVSANLYPLEHQAPEASMNLARFARRALPKAARQKPLWNTEINYGLRGGPAAKEISPRKQAAYVARTLVLNAASPVSRVYWYAWGLGSIANTHLVTPDGSELTRAGRAWVVTATWLSGAEVRGCSHTGRGRLRGVYVCTFRDGAEGRRIYWKPRGRPVGVRTPSTTRSWSSLSGTTTERSGHFRIRVGQAPVLVTFRR